MALAPEGAAVQNPVNFGKRLAHTDKAVRDRGFRTLQQWLRKHPELERLDFMKLWKGLYFGMWMADKRPVQQELSVQIALLISDVPREKQVMWVDCFWETMQDAWEKLDKHRLSKYLLFVRIIMAETFKVLRVNGWDLAEVQKVATIFARTSLAGAAGGPNVPSVALIIHFTRVFWEELQPQLDQKPAASQEVLMAMLEPFAVMAESSGIFSVVKTTLEHMFTTPAVPKALEKPITDRLADAAGKVETPKKNREALYDAVDLIETRIKERDAPPAPAQAERTGPGKRKRARKRSAAIAAAAAAAADDDEKDEEGPAPVVVSPLLLPRAAMAAKKKAKRKPKAEAEDVAAKPAAGVKKGVKRKGKAAAANDAAKASAGAGAAKKRRKKASA